MRNKVAAIAFAATSVTTRAEDGFPTCGSCWCVPDDGGMAPCPNPVPQTAFDEVTIEGFRAKRPIDILRLECNPYDDPSCATSPPQEFIDMGDGAVCALIYDQGNCSSYSMVSFESWADFEGDPSASTRGVVTHEGSCGLCSTAQDLSVYLREDFTTAGKQCATRGLRNESAGFECYEALGLTAECAKIWNYDGIYDGTQCLQPCASHITDPNNGPPPACTLSPCLECDEVQAGPVFSSMGGRTRRRSGLLSEIIRNCSSVASGITHDPNANCGSSAS